MSIANQFKPIVMKAGTKLTPEKVRDLVQEAVAVQPAGPVELTVHESVIESAAFKKAEEAGIVRKVGRPSSGKVVTTLRLDPEVIAALKAAGPGWQARANELLRNALKL